MWSFFEFSSPRIFRAVVLAAGIAGVVLLSASAQADDAVKADAAVEKANIYIEVAKMTARAAESWERYASWVNMKTGPTGKERYISYGMYEVHDATGLFEEARKAASREPATPALDAVMARYMTAFDRVAPVLNRANAYYEAEGYKSDKMAEGKALHAEMVPLVAAFLAEREIMLKDLRVFVRDVEGQEVSAIEAREGRQSRVWQVANVMHAANRIIDVFPRPRPQYYSAEEMDAEMMALGPDTPGEKFDQLIAGVKPAAAVVIDMKAFGTRLAGYSEAVDTFEAFTKEKADEELADLKDKPRRMLAALRALQVPLAERDGRDSDAASALVGPVVQSYFDMFNEANPLTNSRLRYLE